MEKIKSKFDDTHQKIRPGTTWVSGFTQPGNNDDLRSIDVDGTEMRFIPASRYYASCPIKRGQALSIAQLQDLSEEQSKNKYAYVKITDPDLDETCIGIAMNYAEEGQIVHIQSTGKFNYLTTDSVLYSEEAAKKEIFLKADGWKYDQVRGQKLYIKKLYNNITKAEEDENNLLRPGANTNGGIAKDEAGDAFDTDHVDTSVAADDSDWFTYDFADSVYNAKSTIQIGTLTDAPTTNLFYYTKDEEGKWYQQISETQKVEIDDNKDVVVVEYDKEQQKVVTAEAVTLRFIDTEIPKGSTPPKANEALWLQLVKEEEDVKYYAAVDDLTVTIELEITGDTRGPLDNTQFLLTLGETIYFDTKKQDVDLSLPHCNEGIYDELKVLSIASGIVSGPVFRLFLSTHGNVAYKKAESFKNNVNYYVKYPGNVYVKVNNPTEENFDKNFVVAENWDSDVEYFEKDQDKTTYTSKGKLKFEDFSKYESSLYYKLEYYEVADKLDYAFIGVRKLDGDTCIIPVLCDFKEENLAGGSVLVDPNDEGYFRLSQQFTSGAEQEYFIPVGKIDEASSEVSEKDSDEESDENSNKEYYVFDSETNEFVLAEDVTENERLFVREVRSPKIIIEEPVLELSRDTLQKAVTEALQKVFVSNKTRSTNCTPIQYSIGDDGFHISTEEVGGYYDIYISSNLLHLITSTQVRHGQDAEPGTAVLADIRDNDRLSVVGVVISNNTGVHRAGEIVKVMRMGRITTLGNLLPGQDYYLGLNGRLTAQAQYWYDHQVPIGTAESKNYFIVDISQNPLKNYSGNFPLGYLKPSIYGMAEKGFVVADGKTVYNKGEYPELYNMLLNWFDVEELKPSNVTEDLYNKYENWSLSQIFTDVFGKITQLEQEQSSMKELQKASEKLLKEVADMKDEMDKNIQDFQSILDAQNELIRSERLLRQLSNGSATLVGSTHIDGEEIRISRSSTLDLKSFKLDASGNSAGHMLIIKPEDSETEINVTIENGSLGHSEIDADTSGVVYVAGKANVVLENVDIDGGAESNPVYLNNADATVTIKSGNYTTQGNQAVYVQNGRKVRIEGGQFSATPWKGKYYTLNLKDSLVTSEKPAIDTLEVVGGSFLEFNPAESYAEPNGPVNLVPRGYKVIKEVKSEQVKVLDEDTNEEVDNTIQHNWYTVVKMEPLEAFKEAISYGGDVVLESDLNVPSESINITKDLVLDLNNFTLTADGDENGHIVNFIKAEDSSTESISVTIKNGTIKGSDNIERKDNGVLLIRCPINLTLENVKIDGGTSGTPVWLANEKATVTINSGEYTTQDNQAVYVQNGEKVYIKGGKFKAEPWNSKYYTVNLLDALTKDTNKQPKDFVEITGGEFVNFDPSKSMAEPNAPVSYLPEGYEVIQENKENSNTENTIYIVKKKEESDPEDEKDIEGDSNNNEDNGSSEDSSNEEDGKEEDSSEEDSKRNSEDSDEDDLGNQEDDNSQDGDDNEEEGEGDTPEGNDENTDDSDDQNSKEGSEESEDSKSNESSTEDESSSKTPQLKQSDDSNTFPDIASKDSEEEEPEPAPEIKTDENLSETDKAVASKEEEKIEPPQLAKPSEEDPNDSEEDEVDKSDSDNDVEEDSKESPEVSIDESKIPDMGYIPNVEVDESILPNFGVESKVPDIGVSENLDENFTQTPNQPDVKLEDSLIPDMSVEIESEKSNDENSEDSQDEENLEEGLPESNITDANEPDDQDSEKELGENTDNETSSNNTAEADEGSGDSLEENEEEDSDKEESNTTVTESVDDSETVDSGITDNSDEIVSEDQESNNIEEPEDEEKIE